MSKRGENIYRRKDNRWEGRYIKGRDQNGRAQLGYVYARSYNEVKHKLALAKTSTSEPQKRQKKDLEYYLEGFLSYCKTNVKPSTLAKYRVIISNHIISEIGSVSPQNLTSATVDALSAKLISEKGLSPKSVRDILSVLKSAVKYINRQENGIVGEIEFVYPRERKKEMRVLSKEEQERLVAFLLTDMDNVKFGVLLALLTGMRIGELCALRWENISSDSIRINETMQRLAIYEETDDDKKTRIEIGDAKSESSRRDIPLTNFAASLCQKIRPLNPMAYVLTGSEYKFMEPRALQYKFSRYASACNLKDVHFHCLRHTFATRCVEVGFEVKSLSEVLGHSSVKITLDRYVHSSPELKRMNMEKLAAIGL